MIQAAAVDTQADNHSHTIGADGHAGLQVQLAPMTP